MNIKKPKALFAQARNGQLPEVREAVQVARQGSDSALRELQIEEDLKGSISRLFQVLALCGGRMGSGNAGPVERHLPKFEI